ncbi:MAG: hypothetical protein M0Z94_09285 [Dehalococcoidales bacterium]|nr:hypothetical protein [Dehalococcoidales bacterium]
MLGLATPRRRVPYTEAGATIHVPVEVWQRSLEVVRLYGTVGSEGLVFWGGIVTADTIQVTGLYIPAHEPQGGRVKVTAEEGRWLLRRLKERDEKLIAQFHSHGGLAGHSYGDDERAASAHEGFISLVAPYFGRGVKAPKHCGVHEYDGRGFLRLSEDEVCRRIVVDSLFEERLPIPIVPVVTEPPKRKSWLRTIASSLKRKLIG